jgi:hypothetical protein
MSDTGMVDTTGFSVLPGQQLLGSIGGALGVGSTGDPRLLTRPAAIDQLTTKYRELGPQLQSAPPWIANALVQYDSARVARGAMPLNDTETAKIIQTALTGKPATPQSDRSILNVPGNFLRDMGDIVRSIPRLPGALVNEARAIPQMGDEIRKAQQEGANPIAAIARAPGVRLLPGAYTVGNIASGGQGLREAVTHPLMTVLDVLPAASKLAEGSRAAQVAAAAGDTTRPLGKALLSRVAEDGTLEPRALARAGRALRDETAAGQRLTTMFDLGSEYVRPFMRERDMQSQQIQGIGEGNIKPTNADEAALSRAFEVTRKYADAIPETRRGDLAREAELGNVGWRDELSDIENAYISDYQEAQGLTKAARASRQLIDDIEVDGSAETYARPQADQYRTLRVLGEQTRTKAFMRSQVKNPTLAVDDYLAAIRGVDDTRLFGADSAQMTTAQRGAARSQGMMSRAEATERARAAQHAMTRMGYDTSELAKAISKFGKNGTTADLERAVAAFEDAYPRLMDNPRVAKVMQRQADSYVKRTAKFTEAKAAKIDARADQFLTRTAPARFKPQIDSQVEAIAAAQMAAMGVDKLMPAEYAQILREVTGTWRDMKAKGIDPVFVHQVSPNRLGQVLRPQVGEVANAVTAAKIRTSERAATIHDLDISLTHEAMELVTQQRDLAFAEHVGNSVGRTQAELEALFAPKAQALMDKAQGRLTYDSALQQAIGREYTKFDTVNGYNWGSPVLKRFSDDQVFIPNATANALKAIRANESPFAFLEPVTKVFRTSVIGLSPRTQLYNILGGAIMTTAESGPGVWKHMSEAWKLARDPSLATDPALAAALGQSKRLFSDLDQQSLSSHAIGTGEWLKGKTLRRWFDEVQRGKAGKVTDALGRAVEKGNDLNGMFDNFYRAMAYLDGRDRGLTRGMTREAAERAGLEVTRKVMMDWAGMTPFERSIMKSIIPFYGFTRHALNYVFRYPMDHPLRMAIVSHLGKAEAEDGVDELGTRFLGSIFLGGPDSMGRVQSLNLDSVNPFRDTANMLTLQGFLGSTNPVIATVLQSVGLDQGDAELYPTLRYDPETGRLATTQGNPLLAFAENTVPQTQILTGLLGLNGEFRDRARRDPASAVRSIASAAGLPLIWRQQNVGSEVIKAELARQKSAASVLQGAVTSGNWANALRYPSLRPVYDQYQQLPPEVLQSLQAPAVEDVRAQAPVFGTVTAGDAPGAGGGSGL